MSERRPRGRPPLPAADRHGQRINVNLTAAQIEALDAVRGDKARGEWVRDAVAAVLSVRAFPRTPVRECEWLRDAVVESGIRTGAASS
jgi:hypothetical protein